MIKTIWTVGHSNRELSDFMSLLNQYGIEAVADVRRFPGSKRQPHFARVALEESLREHGLSYIWLPQLGGRRRPVAGSPNTAWRNVSFQGYADHIATEEFESGLIELLALAHERRTTLMCAELLWWRCHRALISDVLKVRKYEVIHILDERQTSEHPFTSPARVVDGRLTYGA
jgi:uncharacterized protein (DUF488 family)